MVLEDPPVRIGRPPRPGNLRGEIGCAAEAARPYRSVSALFDRTRFEDHGMSRGGCQSRRPLSEPSPSEHGFQLCACCPHRLPIVPRCVHHAEFLPPSGGSYAAEHPCWHTLSLPASEVDVSVDEGARDPTIGTCQAINLIRRRPWVGENAPRSKTIRRFVSAITDSGDVELAPIPQTR